MLHELLGPGRMTPWFQPIVSTSSRTIHRFEALVRYERADGVVVQPADLLPRLEQAGAAHFLFPVVLRAALSACAEWRRRDLPAGVAVNVTTADLRDRELPGLVRRCLADAALPASALTLELSEQELLVDSGPAVATLDRLRSIGVRVAVDDFGAGYSSLSRLADVAVSELKIDRGLVVSADADPRKQIVLRSAVDLGHRLGLEVVAEGVEDDALAATVTAVGADSIQGYLLSRPLPLADLLERYTRPEQPGGPLDTRPRSRGDRPGPAVVPRPGLLRRVRDRLGRATLPLVALNSLLYLVWLVLQPGGRDVGLWLGNLAYAPVTLAGAALAVLAGRRGFAVTGDARRRRAWFLLAAGLGAYFLGNVFQWLYEAVLDRRATPGAADVGFLGFYPLAMAGVLGMSQQLRDRRVRRTVLVDVLTVMIGAAVVVSQLVLLPGLPDRGAVLPALVASAYPLGDLALIFAISVVLLRGVEAAVRLPLQLLAAAFTMFVITDSVYVNLDAYDSLHPVNAGWIASLTLFVLAAAAGARAAVVPAPSDPGAVLVRRNAVSRVPYVAVAGAYLMVLLHEWDDPIYPDRVLSLAAVVLAGLVGLRQYMALRDHHELGRAYSALSSVDELTGLWTRRHFLLEAERAFTLPARADTGISLVLLDIESFTGINERHGQQAGDQVLTAVAEACRNQLRQGDLLGRYGGDEIIALLPNSTADAADAIAARIDEHLGGLCIDTASGPVVVRIAHGIAFARAGSSLDDALAEVAARLHEAKATPSPGAPATPGA